MHIMFLHTLALDPASESIYIVPIQSVIWQMMSMTFDFFYKKKIVTRVNMFMPCNHKVPKESGLNGTYNKESLCLICEIIQ